MNRSFQFIILYSFLALQSIVPGQIHQHGHDHAPGQVHHHHHGNHHHVRPIPVVRPVVVDDSDTEPRKISPAAAGLIVGFFILVCVFGAVFFVVRACCSRRAEQAEQASPAEEVQQPQAAQVGYAVSPQQYSVSPQQQYPAQQYAGQQVYAQQPQQYAAQPAYQQQGYQYQQQAAQPQYPGQQYNYAQQVSLKDHAI